MVLPNEFISYTKQLMGEERFARYLAAFDEEPPVSIRLNPRKALPRPEGESVPWCNNAYYLDHRPNFTFDPLFHVGCYYVQEAASMFIDHILRQYVDKPVLMLDLCAAPGGKSTAAISALPEGSTLFSNEPVRNRASILLENVQKWGYDNHYVTSLYPKDYRKSRMTFDLILCDVPCSGEGMFRKDPATVSEWSPQNVTRCQELQRDIVNEAWQCLRPGGLLIYSTCTFNTKENEENVRWMMEQFDVHVLPVKMQPEWNITGSLLEGFDQPVYRFIPGITRSEGLFICVLQKGGSQPDVCTEQSRSLHGAKSRIGRSKLSLPTLSPLPLHTDGLQVELTYQQAIAFLRREALVLSPDTPRGLIEVCFMGHPLGTVKNLGTRANNLYPKEWRIKSTHMPPDFSPISPTPVPISPNKSHPVPTSPTPSQTKERT